MEFITDKNGEIIEVNSFMDDLFKNMNKYLYNKTMAGMDTDDVKQEIAIKVYTALKYFDRNKSSLKTFVNTVINNCIKDIYKKCSSIKNLSFINSASLTNCYDEENEDNHDIVQFGVNERGFEYIEFKETFKQLKLTEQEKKVVLLKLDGYESHEVAKILNISKARVSQICKNVQKKINTSVNC